MFSDLTLREYEQAIKAAAKSVHSGHFITVPHSLRHTCPSRDAYTEALSRQDIMDRGKWRCLASIRRYEKHGMLLRQWQKLTPSVRSDIVAHAGRLKKFVFNEL